MLMSRVLSHDCCKFLVEVFELVLECVHLVHLALRVIFLLPPLHLVDWLFRRVDLRKLVDDIADLVVSFSQMLVNLNAQGLLIIQFFVVLFLESNFTSQWHIIDLRLNILFFFCLFLGLIWIL